MLAEMGEVRGESRLEAFDSQINSIVAGARLTKRIAGISVGVARAGEVVFARGSGVADLEQGVAATSETAYCVGSITKQFTATAILQLAERGLLNLDDELSEHLPGCASLRPPPRLRHLLNHTSGIAGDLDLAMLARPGSQDEISPHSFVRLLAQTGLASLPGTEWRYSSAGFYLLGLVIESVTEDSYWNYLRSQILGPSGMRATWFGPDDVPKLLRARGYESRPSGFARVDFPSIQQTFSSGGLFSTTPDLLTWQLALSQGSVVSRASWELMTAPEQLDGWQHEYGYGVFITDLAGHREISHDGNTGGFSCQLAHYPDDSLTVVVLANCRSHEAEGVEKAITRCLLGVPERPPTGQRSERPDPAIYVGTYRSGTTDIPVYEENDALWVRAPGGHATELVWQGDRLFVSATDNSLSFAFGVEAGRPAGFTVSRGKKNLAIVKRSC